jgi:O-antigen/teichoic acid export membrane protein
MPGRPRTSEQVRRCLAFISPSLSPTTWMTIDRLTQMALWLIIFAILAPVLGPRPYGLFSIVMVFVSVSEWILIEGTAEALITIDELNHLHMTTANLASGGLALTLSLVTSALAPAIGMLFHDQEITRLIWALAPLPVVTALSATPTAILRRSLKFKQLAVRGIGGLLIGGTLGIVLAIAGAGVWALVFQALGQRIAEFIILWISVPVRLGFRWSGAHFREISPAGMNVFVGRIMGFASGQLPRIIIGYVLGPTTLGLFTLANRILDLIVQTAVQPRTAVGRIELRDSKPGSAEFERIFSRMTQNVSILSFPLFCGAAALTPDLFRIWLDQRWSAGVVPTQLMLLSGLPLVVFYCIDSALLGAKLSSVFKWISSLQALTTLITVMCVVSLGLDMICLSLAVRSAIVLPIFLWLFGRACNVSVSTALRPTLRSLTGAIVMAGILSLPLLRQHRFHSRYDFVFLVIGGIAFYVMYLRSFARDQFRTFLGGIFVHRS